MQNCHETFILTTMIFFYFFFTMIFLSIFIFCPSSVISLELGKVSYSLKAGETSSDENEEYHPL